MDYIKYNQEVVKGTLDEVLLRLYLRNVFEYNKGLFLKL